MANVTIAGDAVVVTTALKLGDLKDIKKYRPAALTLKGGEDGKEPLFSIGIEKEAGKGSFNAVGISFPNGDDSKPATLTMVIPGKGDGLEAYFVDTFGGSLMQLNKLEETLPAVLEEIAADKASIAGCITRAL